ncbi:helix-turn-helix domain-containing protein [Streptomyces sp. WMMC500]|uniref:AraC family transcriptional regulator n=1 Tax=Streptomyces sp. WMMC500 TaxID=3015154 RepID=UPI00248ABABA|nr:helix-turn-helix domain-containing protein [Streptomyces sp. WMMC500]WBB60569.1 helix-turn-helix domain-containing protein [Streptomyces sp. WMMC500]
MGLEIEGRPSDSPYVSYVWRSRSEGVDRMTAVASARWDLVFWQSRGGFHAAVAGPESRVSTAPVPEEAAFFGITFALGTTLTHLPAPRLVDGGLDIPDATRRSFWLKDAHWPVPGPDDAEAFAQRLVRAGVLVRDPLVTEVMRGGTPDASPRTAQRRFRAATGFTHGAARQIERARHAAVLLRGGAAAGDVVHRLGYYDEPHLARALGRFVGRTAGQLRDDPRPAQPLSLLYKT